MSKILERGKRETWGNEKAFVWRPLRTHSPSNRRDLDYGKEIRKSRLIRSEKRVVSHLNPEFADRILHEAQKHTYQMNDASISFDWFEYSIIIQYLLSKNVNRSSFSE